MPLRLRLAEESATNRLHGGWWPRSRDLAVELPALVEQLPRTVHVGVAPSDWDPAPGRVPVPGGEVAVEPLTGDERHLVELTTADGTLLRLLVAPPELTAGQADEALLAAATTGNAHSAADLLEEVLAQPDVDPRDRWTDTGDTWWDDDSEAPSYRKSP